MHEVELQNRIAAGWAAFHRNKAELRSQPHRLKDPLRLFSAVITPVVLYGSSAWALTQVMEAQLRAVWRKMLRYVLCIHSCNEHHTPEDWVDFIKRATHRIEAVAQEHRIENWVRQYRRKKWRMAGRLATAEDGRWSQKILTWRPLSGAGRCPGRPKLRWADALERYAGGDWVSTAADPSQWRLLEDGFVNAIE